MNTQTKQAKHMPVKQSEFHSELPWIYSKADEEFPIRQKDGYAVNFRFPGNAKLIIKAVNSHEELLGALRALIQAHQDGLPGLQTEQAFALCRKAIAHATGG